MINKTAIILCGGKGTRLGEIGKKMPKTLVKVQEKPILWYILKSLKKITLIILYFRLVLRVIKSQNI